MAEPIRSPNKMVEFIKATLGDIDAMKWDDERAHGMEDGLHIEVLEWMTKSPYASAEVRRVAREALKSRDLEFGRWVG